MTTLDQRPAAPGDGGFADPFAACLAGMTEALDGVADTPAWSLTETAVVERFGQVLGLRSRVEELTSRLLDSLVSRDVPRLAGASSTRAWLTTHFQMSPQEAAKLVRESALHHGSGGEPRDVGALHQLSADQRCAVTVCAWRGGLLTAEQALLIGQTVDKVSVDVPQIDLDRLQLDLAAHARRLSYGQLRTVCRHAAEVIDPDGADRKLADQLQTEEERVLALCELVFKRSGDGWTSFHGRLPDAQAEIWKRALEALGSPRRLSRQRRPATAGAGNTPADALSGQRKQWGEDYPGVDRSPIGDPARGIEGADRRTFDYSQRLGRAMFEMLEHLPIDGLPDHGATGATIVLTMELDKLRKDVGEALLDTDTALSPGQVRRLACNARVVPAVLGSDSSVLDLGRTQRLFDRHQRLALAVRDRGCIWPGCDRPPAWCEAHHVTEWSQGGDTDVANGCLLCSFHHHLAHGSDGWRVAMAGDGVPEVIPPTRVDPSRQPRRHERLRPRC